MISVPRARYIAGALSRRTHDDELEATTVVVVSVEDCDWDVDDDVVEDDGGTVVVTVDDDGDWVELGVG
jgi:hypothetical protein